MNHRYVMVAFLVSVPLVSFAQSTAGSKEEPTPPESKSAAAPGSARKEPTATLKDPIFITPTKPAEVAVNAPGDPTSSGSPFAPQWASEGLAFAPGFVAPRVTLRHDFGSGPGFQNGFTYLEGFIPWRQTRSDKLVFSNLRTVNFDHADLWEFNVGIGARKYNSATNRIFGAHLNYDGRTTIHRNYFNQITFGVESLGQYLDFRANAYLPVGTDRHQFAEGVGNPQFAGFNILLDRTKVSEVAMRGFDTEIGTPIPPYGRWDARAFIGYYHYSNTGLQAVNGIRGRIEANVCDAITLHLSVQNDAVFDTTVYGGVALHFGAGRHTRSGVSRGVINRMGDRIVRDPNIVVNNQVDVTREAALDPQTGAPILVRHANSAAAAGGDGTVERPYQTLGDLQTGSTAKEILFLHANSTFTNQSLTLKNNQRLLGEGTDHLFTATQGTFLLPRATTGTNAPELVRTSDSLGLVTLAKDNEVSGLKYSRTAGSGSFIYAKGNLGTFNINHNTTVAGEYAVVLESVTGTGVISENNFGNHTLNAIRVLQTDSNMTLAVQKNSFTGNVTGIFNFQTGGTSLLTVENNTFNSGTSGIFYRLDSGTSRMLVQNNTFKVTIGIDYFLTAGTSFSAIRDNTFNSTVAVRGIIGSSTHTLQLRNNSGTGTYTLNNIAGTFNLETFLGTNPAPTKIGTITDVAPGSAGFP